MAKAIHPAQKVAGYLFPANYVTGIRMRALKPIAISRPGEGNPVYIVICISGLGKIVRSLEKIR